MAVTWGDVLAFMDRFLAAVAAIVLAVIVLALAVYILAYFQHPDDVTQSWWTKIVAVLSLFVVFYAPVFAGIDFSSTNEAACRSSENFADDVSLFLTGQCATPSRVILHLLVYCDILLVYFIIPFTMNFSMDAMQTSFRTRLLRALAIATLLSGCVAGAYALLWYFFGFVELQVDQLESGLIAHPAEGLALQECIGIVEPEDIYSSSTGVLGAVQQTVSCDAVSSLSPSAVLSLRIDFGEYIIVLHTLLGAVLFSVVGGVGLASYPWHLISGFIHRERRPLTKSEYIRRVQAISEKARIIRDKAYDARKEELNESTEGSRGKLAIRRYRNRLLRRITLLEMEDKALQPLFPEGEDPAKEWTITVMKYWGELFVGIIGAILSVAWLINVVTFVIPDPPISLFLNRLLALQSNDYWQRLSIIFVVTMLSTHLVLCSVDGLCTIGLSIKTLPVHPLTLGTTMIDSMLMNCLVLLFITPAIMAFQASSLALISANSNTAIMYGFEYSNMRILRFFSGSYLLLYAMLGFFALTLLLGIRSIIQQCAAARQARQREEARQSSLSRY